MLSSKSYMKHNSRSSDPATEAQATLEHHLRVSVIDPPSDFAERTIRRWRTASRTPSYSEHRTSTPGSTAWQWVLKPRLALALTLVLIVVNAVAIFSIELHIPNPARTSQSAASNASAAVTALSVSDVLKDYQLEGQDLTNDDHEH